MANKCAWGAFGVLLLSSAGCIDWLQEVQNARDQFERVYNTSEGLGKKISTRCDAHTEYDTVYRDRVVDYSVFLGRPHSGWRVYLRTLWDLKKKEFTVDGTHVVRLKMGKEVYHEVFGQGRPEAALKNLWDYGRLTGLCPMEEEDETLALSRQVFNSPLGKAIWGETPANWLRRLTEGMRLEIATVYTTPAKQVLHFTTRIDVTHLVGDVLEYTIFAQDESNKEIALEVEGEKPILLENYLINEHHVCSVSTIRCHDANNETGRDTTVPPYTLDPNTWEFSSSSRESISVPYGQFTAQKLLFRHLKERDRSASVWISKEVPFYFLKRETPDERSELVSVKQVPTEDREKERLVREKAMEKAREKVEKEYAKKNPPAAAKRPSAPPKRR